MSELALGNSAPDFVLNDFKGQLYKLSDYKGSQNAILAFLRGFA